MNALTRRIVTEQAEAHKKSINADYDFCFSAAVKNEYIDFLSEYFDYQYHLRALSLFAKMRPDYFDIDREGIYLKNHPYFMQIGHYINEIATRRMLAIAARDEELRLDDWGDLHERIAKPQIALF